MTRVTIIGAGNSGLAMAAHLSLMGNEVYLWNRSPDTITDLSATKCIHCHGIIERDAQIKIATSDIEKVMSDIDIILITTPANSHRELAGRLCPYLSYESCVVLNPGRTFGALEFQTTLIQNGCTSLPLIAEAQTIIYTCRKIDPSSVNLLSFKKDVLIAAIDPENTETVINRLPECIHPYFVASPSMIQTSIGNVGMILHCAPVILNAGWIESPKTAFKYYYEGITPTVAGFLEKLDSERIEVSRHMGDEVESTAEWLRRSYDIKGETLYDCIQNNESYKTIDAPTTLQHRYIFEDIPCGLVPLEAVGKRIGLSMRYTEMVIDFASTLLNVNFRGIGRNLKRMGLNDKSGAEIAKIVGKTL